MCAPPRNPRTIICQNPARQRNLKTRSPEIHFPQSSTNPLAQIHKSNMLAEFCFAEYAADLKSASSTCCQQTHTQDNWFLYTLDDRSVNLFPGWWRWWWWERSQENYDSMACISDVWCLVNLSDFFDEKAVKGVRVNMKANDQGFQDQTNANNTVTSDKQQTAHEFKLNICMYASGKPKAQFTTLTWWMWTFFPGIFDYWLGLKVVGASWKDTWLIRGPVVTLKYSVKEKRHSIEDQ